MLPTSSCWKRPEQALSGWLYQILVLKQLGSERREPPRAVFTLTCISGMTATYGSRRLKVASSTPRIILRFRWSAWAVARRIKTKPQIVVHFGVVVDAVSLSTSIQSRDAGTICGETPRIVKAGGHILILGIYSPVVGLINWLRLILRASSMITTDVVPSTGTGGCDAHTSLRCLTGFGWWNPCAVLGRQADRDARSRQVVRAQFVGLIRGGQVAEGGGGAEIHDDQGHQRDSQQDHQQRDSAFFVFEFSYHC